MKKNDIGHFSYGFRINVFTNFAIIEIVCCLFFKGAYNIESNLKYKVFRCVFVNNIFKFGETYFVKFIYFFY